MPTKPEKKTPVPATARRADLCVVDDGKCIGRAVNGKVCSYHAVWYDRDGNRRRT